MSLCLCYTRGMTNGRERGLVDEAAKVLAGSGLDVERAARLAAGGPTRELTGRDVALGAALRDGWRASERTEAAYDNVAPGEHPAVAVAAFDLGQRFRAALTGRPAQRLARTPFHAGGPLVAVTAVRCGAHTEVTVQRPGTGPVTALDAEALAAVLSPAGADNFETLVVADRATLARLGDLARPALRASPADAAGALIDWWTQRSQHPGTGAVLVAADACSTRWVTGGAPDTERSTDTWARWLRVPGTGTEALLGLARRLVAGEPLRVPGIADDDAYSWGWFVESTRDWRMPDSPKVAAIGLANRNGAAAMWARSLLDDPGWAARERYTGRVVVATVARPPTVAALTVTTIDGVCRHRPGDTVALAIEAAGADEPLRVRARLVAVAVRPDGGVTLDLAPSKGDREAVVDHAGPGTTVVVRPEEIAPFFMVATRKAIAAAYGPGGSWVTSRAVTAPRIRRDVPLAVVIAGAV